MYGYYVAGLALIQALNAVDGDLSDGQAALREALSTMTLEAPYGTVTLDENRQGIIDTYVAQLVLDDATGEVVQKTVSIVPQVDQTFGGTFGPDTPSPSRRLPGLRDPRPAVVGQRDPGRRRRAPDGGRRVRWQRCRRQRGHGSGNHRTA